MPVNYSEDNELLELGTAGFLKVEAEEGGFRGAFFVVNALGEPVEFTYTHIEVPNSFLWRKADIARHAVRQMAGSLFSLCPASPRLIFCLSDEINLESFKEDVKLDVPLCGVAPSRSSDGSSTGSGKQNGPDSSVQLAWFPGRIPAI